MMTCNPLSSPFSLYFALCQWSRDNQFARDTDLLLRICEELSDILLRLTNELAQDLGAVHDLWFARVEHLANLPCHKSLSGARGTVKQDT